ncbi:acyl-CoA thioesterase II [Croceicoccus estronivorus]|uniref:acyl-CoA thioesterase n=1 Tax=Croceicoccus estronivorus TaxID=1172626 RepID=UPI000831AF10|nr:acyl-CoA thioesterase II [Croceicoccus estronivorus]OCC22662.1 acyl-CoA thioesterase II [Croceicoccus estronivorus]
MLLEQTPERLVADLVLLLDMEPRGANRFEGRRYKLTPGRLFGGQVIAQALAAAEQTVPDNRAAHSLHAYFLRSGSSELPVSYMVTNDFDGRSFSNRRVVASQQGEPILNLTASFHVPETGMEHQRHPMPDVPPPEDLEPFANQYERFRQKDADRNLMAVGRPRSFDLRMVEPPCWQIEGAAEPVNHIWIRAVAPLPDDPRVHRAVLAYASDMHLLMSSLRPHGKSMFRGEVRGASLDHAIWFHQPFRADDWLLYVTESPWAGNGRGFARGQVFSRDGRLVASTAQEGVIRAI